MNLTKVFVETALYPTLSAKTRLFWTLPKFYAQKIMRMTKVLTLVSGLCQIQIQKFVLLWGKMRCPKIKKMISNENSLMHKQPTTSQIRLELLLMNILFPNHPLSTVKVSPCNQFLQSKMPSRKLDKWSQLSTLLNIILNEIHIKFEDHIKRFIENIIL